jgi:hypothetical protein
MAAARTSEAGGGRLGGLLLWFAVLGGAVAWAVHLLAAWSIDELTCAAGSGAVSGVPLRVAVSLAAGIPAAVAVAALMLSWRAWRRTAAATEQGVDRAMGRAKMLALVGLWSNLFFLAIIVLGGAAILVFPPCQR